MGSAKHAGKHASQSSVDLGKGGEGMAKNEHEALDPCVSCSQLHHPRCQPA